MAQSPDGMTNRQAELRELAEWAKDFGARLLARQMRGWRTALGDRLEGMLASRATAEAFIADADPRVRAGAFSLVCHHWKPDPLQEDVYWNAALHDIDPRVRNAAGACLVGLYEGTGNRKLSGIFARTIRDESISLGFRLDAYIGLASVQNIEIPHHLMLAMKKSKKSNGGFPSGLGWAMIDSFLD
jgi:hypothetical protein